MQRSSRRSAFHFPVQAAVLLSLPLLHGCLVARTGVNDPIARESVESLRPGMSATDVVAALGAPVEVVQLGRRSAYRFDHSKRKRAGLFLLLVGFFNEDTREDRVWAFFDENDVLTHLGATLDADETRYAMPWSDVYE